MKTGKATIELDGEKFIFNFRKSGEERGQGYNGIDDGIFISRASCRRLTAMKS